MFVSGAGWTPAGDIAPGDTIRNADLAALRVLAVEQDLLPTRVYNLEIAGAHTYFAGELEAWAHNAGRGHNGGPPFDPFDYAREPSNLCEQLALDEIMANPDLGADTGISLGDPSIPDGARKMRYTRRGRCGTTTIHYIMNKFGISGDFKFKNR